MVVQSEKNGGEVTFILKGVPNAKQVYLVGDFNRWNPSGQRMSKYRDGTFRVKLVLKPGQYQYKYVVDGVWVNDAEAHEQVSNPFGTLNSLVRIG
jgi:1,4-alpha-glucan branching enzyme